MPAIYIMEITFVLDNPSHKPVRNGPQLIHGGAFHCNKLWCNSTEHYLELPTMKESLRSGKWLGVFEYVARMDIKGVWDAMEECRTWKEYHLALRREQRGTSSIRHHPVGAKWMLIPRTDQHLKDFFKLVDSLDLDGDNRKRTRLSLFQFSLRDQASNWLELLPAGSITTWDDLTTRFLAQFFPPGRTAKLCNDILMFQQHHGESLSEAWTHFKDLLQKVPHHGIDLWL
ncbi:zinc finger, CCHC-type containing protein [Tanacetum coccineum]